MNKNGKFKCYFTIVLILLLLCGCNAKKEASEADLLSAAIDSYIQEEIFTGESLPLMLEYQNAILGKITYEIQSYNMRNGTMDVEFTYIDVLNLADSISNPNIQEKDYYAACLEKLNSGDYKTITEVILVEFESLEDAYVLAQSEELTNMLSGGVLDYYLELLEEMEHD